LLAAKNFINKEVKETNANLATNIAYYICSMSDGVHRHIKTFPAIIDGGLELYILLMHEKLKEIFSI
jgi:hypothetical protein